MKPDFQLPFDSKCIPCGSRVTCSPAPMDTDQDWLVKVPEGHMPEFTYLLEHEGWIVGGSEIPESDLDTKDDHRFLSFARGDDNIIATESAEFYKTIRGSNVCIDRFEPTLQR